MPMDRQVLRKFMILDFSQCAEGRTSTTLPIIFLPVPLRLRPKTSSAVLLNVAVLWLGPKFENFVRIGNRPFLKSGRSRGPGRPFRKVGAKPPTFLYGLPGPRGRPDPKNDRFPTLNKLKVPMPKYSLVN